MLRRAGGGRNAAPVASDSAPYPPHRRERSLPEEASRGYIECMRVVGLKLLKNRLSEYIRLAAGGERILVTDRDRVVAELVPPAPGSAETASDAVLAEAVRRGWLKPPVLPQAGPPPRVPVAPLAELLQELDRDRADR